MWNHISDGYPMLLHQNCREFGRAFNRGPKIRAPLLAHLNADGIPVSRPIKIRMLALLGSRHVLNRHTLIHREVPDQVADPVSSRTLGRPQRPPLQCQRVLLCTRCLVLSAVDRDVSRAHRPNHLPAMCAARNHIHFQPDLPHQGGWGNFITRRSRRSGVRDRAAASPCKA